MRWAFAAMIFVSVTSLARSDEPAKTGTIVGAVRYLGDVPEPHKILTTDGNTILHNDIVIDAKSKGLRYAAVLLDKPPVSKKAENAKPVVIDQRDMIFVPRVAAVQEGQKIRFENNDNCNHAVQSFTAKQANQFNVVTPQGQPFEFQFEPQKTPVMIGCPIHNWMKAWVYVVPHPWFAVTDAKGQFKIAEVPAGKQTFVFTHPDSGFRETRTIDVQAAKVNELTVEWKTLKK
jgi:plastocyanin